MRKIIVGFLLAVLCTIPFSVSTEAEPLKFEDFEYKVFKDQNVDCISISQYTGDASKVTVPEKIDNKPVIEIGYYAFAFKSELTDVVLPSTLKKIDFRAFDGCGITAINLPKGLECLEHDAFRGCEKLASISVPDTITFIGGDAFTETPWLESQMEGGRPVVLNNILVAMKPTDGAVTVPAGVETIVDYAFYQNEDLFSVILPNGLKHIGSDAFNGCKNLKSIAIPPTVETIGENALNRIEKIGLVFYSHDLNIDEAGLDDDKINLIYSTDEQNKKLSVDELRNGDKLVYFTESQINIPEYIGGYKTEVSEAVKAVIESFEKTIQFSHVHVGGTATCDKPAVCVICEQEYGEKGSHVFSDEWITDGTHHWNECTLCNAKRNYAEHSGGTLTCTEQAECIMCGEKYGTPDINILQSGRQTAQIIGMNVQNAATGRMYRLMPLRQRHIRQLL